MFDFDKSVEIALKTWYPENHDLHTNSHHPLGKLLGEWGELLDDYMKSLYKPNYIFEPLDELGDVWYYERILSSIYGLELSYIGKTTLPELDMVISIPNDDIDILIDTAIYILSSEFLRMKNNKSIIFSVILALNLSYSVTVEICRRYNITLQELTNSNWQKLKPGSERGDQWSSTRIQTNSAI